MYGARGDQWFAGLDYQFPLHPGVFGLEGWRLFLLLLLLHYLEGDFCHFFRVLGVVAWLLGLRAGWKALVVLLMLLLLLLLLVLFVVWSVLGAGVFRYDCCRQLGFGRWPPVY